METHIFKLKILFFHHITAMFFVTLTALFFIWAHRFQNFATLYVIFVVMFAINALFIFPPYFIAIAIFEKESLKIKKGFVTRHVKYTNVVSVKPVRIKFPKHTIASYVIEIKTVSIKNPIIIAPLNKDGFIEVIKKYCPDIADKST